MINAAVAAIPAANRQPATVVGAVDRAREAARVCELDLRKALSMAIHADERLLGIVLHGFVTRITPLAIELNEVADARRDEK